MIGNENSFKYDVFLNLLFGVKVKTNKNEGAAITGGWGNQRMIRRMSYRKIQGSEKKNTDKVKKVSHHEETSGIKSASSSSEVRHAEESEPESSSRSLSESPPEADRLIGSNM